MIFMSIWIISKSLIKQCYWEKKNFITTLYKEITDSDFMHGKRICKNFEIKHLSEYHDLYFKRDQLLLVDVFENFRKMFKKDRSKIKIINWHWFANKGWRKI